MRAGLSSFSVLEILDQSDPDRHLVRIDRPAHPEYARREDSFVLRAPQAFPNSSRSREQEAERYVHVPIV